MEIRDLLPYLFAMADYEDYKTFKMVSVLQNGRAIGITSAYDAAKYILENWPEDAGGPKLENCKEILLKCLAGDCSATIARVAFVEAARESNIFIETTPQPPASGKPDPKWVSAKLRWQGTADPNSHETQMTPPEQELNYDFGTLSTDSGFTMMINTGGRYDFPKHDCRHHPSCWNCCRGRTDCCGHARAGNCNPRICENPPRGSQTSVQL
jgi:hypothetical protein